MKLTKLTVLKEVDLRKTKDNPDKPKITQRLNGKPKKAYNDSDSDNDSKNDSVSDNKNDNKNDSVNKAEILKMTGKTIEEVLQSDYSIEDKHKILTIRMMRQSNYDLSNSDLYT